MSSDPRRRFDRGSGDGPRKGSADLIEGTAAAARARRADPRVEEAEEEEAPVGRSEQVRPSNAGTSSSSGELEALRQRVAKLQAELDEATSAKKAPEVTGAASAESLQRAEERIRDAEQRAKAAERLRDEVTATLDAERLAHEHRISQLEDERAALRKQIAERPPASESGSPEKPKEEATGPASAQAAGPASSPKDAPASLDGQQRAPNYYGAKKLSIVAAPPHASEFGPHKRLLRLAAKIVVFVIIADVVYMNRETIRHAVSPLVDMPKITGTREAVSQLVETLRKDERAHGLPSPEDFPDYVRKSLQTKGGDGADPSRDLWGTPYRLESDAKNYTVRSAGPDREYDTDDDIVATHVRSVER